MHVTSTIRVGDKSATTLQARARCLQGAGRGALFLGGMGRDVAGWGGAGRGGMGWGAGWGRAVCPRVINAGAGRRSSTCVRSLSFSVSCLCIALLSLIATRCDEPHNLRLSLGLVILGIGMT